MIEIDFFGGLHGNFLCFCINALDPSLKQTDPFTRLGTSHLPYNQTLAIKNHYTHSQIPFNGTDVISIVGDESDCLLINLLCFGRAGDYEFDLKNFNVNLYDQIKDTKFNGIIEDLKHSYNVDISETNSIDKGILREYFKFNFHDYSQNSLIKCIKEQKYNFPVLEINFKNFYTFESFICVMENIIRTFNLQYEIDIQRYKELWEKFLSYLTEIKDVENSMEVLDAIQNNQSMSIDFNLLQEAWLNAQLENIYKKEMPFIQEKYFGNTLEIIKYLEI